MGRKSRPSSGGGGAGVPGAVTDASDAPRSTADDGEAPMAAAAAATARDDGVMATESSSTLTRDEALERVRELEAKLKGAIKKGKTIQRELETRERELEAARKASETTSASTDDVGTRALKALETKLAVQSAECEAYKAENESLREKLEALADGDDEDEEDEEGGDGGAATKKTRAALAERTEENAKLRRELNALRAELSSVIAATNTERAAAENARRAAEVEKEAAATARANAEHSSMESAHAVAKADGRVSTLEGEIERLSEANVRAESRLAHLNETFASKRDEYEAKILTLERSAERGDGLERADTQRYEIELSATREALREANAEVARLKMSDATESALAARASESVWKERAQAAMAAAAAAKEAYEQEFTNRRMQSIDGEQASVSSASDVLAAERRAKDAETALAESRAELAKLAERVHGDVGSNASLISQDASLASLSRRLAESEALVLKKNAEIASLTRRFTDLAWRASMSPPDADAAASSKADAAPLLLPAVRRQNKYRDMVVKHRRFIIGGYLTLLHLLAYDYLALVY